LAKGPPDSCGPGCDRWIAIEGRVDKGSAARVERFFRERKDTQRPIYFNSLGGEGRDALAIGRLLRSRKAVGRVGRTIADDCPGTQTDDACELIKTTRDEVTATIATRGAVCASACTFLLFGALTREVAPDTVVAVHGPKIDMDYRLNMNEQRREEALGKVHGEIDRLVFAYVEEMGISRDVMTLAESVSPENFHTLTRQELYSFRIDTRNFVETPWILEKIPSPVVDKVAQVKTESGFRKFEWRFICAGKTQTRLMVTDEVDKAANGNRIVAMVAGSAKPPQFQKFPARVGPYEIWTAVLTPEAMKSLLTVPRLETGESTQLPDGKTISTTLEIDTRGLEAASAQLSAACETLRVRTTAPKWPLVPPPVPPRPRPIVGVPKSI
jgi:hypothetical protein